MTAPSEAADTATGKSSCPGSGQGVVHRHGTEAGDPQTFISTTALEEQDPGRTLVTLRSVFNTKEQRDHVVQRFAAIEGAQQTLDHLASSIATGARRA